MALRQWTSDFKAYILSLDCEKFDLIEKKSLQTTCSTLSKCSLVLLLENQCVLDKSKIEWNILEHDGGEGKCLHLCRNKK